MLNFLPSSVLFLICNILFIFNTLICTGIISLGGIVKLLLPINSGRRLITVIMDKVMWMWATGNGGILKLTSKLEWDVKGLENLDKNSWYLIISNHLSGFDIAAHTYVLRNHIPMLKFFLKKELLYIPFLGLGCWAMGMPFMDRASPKKLKKNPKLRGKDLQTTRKACEQFLNTPTSIMNYVEGSRFTEEKHQRQNSPYRYLLKPKAGGIAFTLSAMGEQFSSLLNITIVYPNTSKDILGDALRGKVNKVVVRIESLPVPFVDDKKYFADKDYRVAFQRWLNDIWFKKDEQIHQLLLENQAKEECQQQVEQL